MVRNILLSFFLMGSWLTQAQKEESVYNGTIVLTFDDACESHFRFVAPLLKQYGFGATFYVCEFPGMFGDSTMSMNWRQI
jgi:peptidoglycan/xylan/chitin deacetylase (PgdA/CDA1 family)